MAIKGSVKPLESVGDRLKYLRLVNGMLQKGIERELLITDKRVSALEHDYTELFNSELIAYARYFKVTPAWILTGSDVIE